MRSLVPLIAALTTLISTPAYANNSLEQDFRQTADLVMKCTEGEIIQPDQGREFPTVIYRVNGGEIFFRYIDGSSERPPNQIFDTKDRYFLALEKFVCAPEMNCYSGIGGDVGEPLIVDYQSAEIQKIHERLAKIRKIIEPLCSPLDLVS